MQDRLKTESGEREIDLHSSMAMMLREYIGEETSRRANSKRESLRQCTLVFASRNGRPLHQSSVLRRKLHPVLAILGQPKCGVHAFRRFRNTYLRNYTSTPPGVLQFWMGSCGRGYVRPLRQEQRGCGVPQRSGREGGIGFELPSKISSQTKQFPSE